jgi:hypothetical protein
VAELHIILVLTKGFMRQRFSIIRQVILIFVVIPLVLSCSPKVPVPTITPETNDRVGDKVVFQQDYSSMLSVPNNVYIASSTEPYVTVNSTLEYDVADKAVRFDVTQNPVGKLIVGGLSPSISTEVSFDMRFGRTNFNAEANIWAGNAWLLVTIRDGTPNILRIRSYYYGPELTYVQSDTPIVEKGKSARFKLTIASNGADRKNVIYVDGVQKISSPITWNAPQFSPTSYDSFMNPSIYFYFTTITPGNSAYLELYSIHQTVPQYKYITPLSNPKMIPFGIDGPHPYEYVHAGLELMVSKGQRGTIWADPEYIRDYSAQDFDSLKQLIANGWELGIHYSERLNELSLDDAVTVMGREYNIIKADFGTTPKSWCSLGNSDNATHADYIFKKLGMVWRNGKNGVLILGNIGNLEDEDWDFWAKTSAAGAVFPLFTHRLDSTPAIKFSISPANFSEFVQNYMDNNIQIVPYFEYWDMIQNSYHTTISNLRFDKGVLMGFTVTNIGGKSRLFITTRSMTTVLDSQGQSVPFEKVEGGIMIEVREGDYVLTGSSQH